MPAIWKGSISFGLVTIPVALVSATKKSAEVSFRMLRESDHSPIRFKRVAEADEQEVPYEKIVKGYEYSKGEFVVLTDEELEQVEVESSQTVRITDFVAEGEINPMFFNKPYFMEPTKGGEKAYALLRDALKKTGKVGIAKVVIRTREYLAALKPVEDALVLELMHFADELVEPSSLNIPKDKGTPNEKEMQMAEMLIENMSSEFEPEKYRDEYKAALMELVEKKIAAGEKELPPAQRKSRQATNVVDLLSVLKESIAETEGKIKPAGKAPRKGPAPSKDFAKQKKVKKSA